MGPEAQPARAGPGPRASQHGRFRLGQLRALRERITAAEVARDCLHHYHALRRELPELAGHGCYRALIVRYTNLDRRSVDALVVRAELARALSGEDRELGLRDIAWALTVRRCLRWRSTRPSRIAACGDIIARQIPAGL